MRRRWMKRVMSGRGGKLSRRRRWRRKKIERRKRRRNRRWKMRQT